jgi:type IV pilus assembly protein PilV
MISYRQPMQSRQRGLTLVEVMITVVVFSIGLLGVAGLHAFAKRATFEASQRSTASELAHTLLEEMRFNSGGLGNFVAAGTLGGGTRAAPAVSCNDPLNACSAAQLATQSLWQWERMLDGGKETLAAADSGGLVDPTACVTGPPGGAAGTYAVTVVWRGVTELTDPAINGCGAGSGLYGSNDEFRRMVVLTSYISPNF